MDYRLIPGILSDLDKTKLLLNETPYSELRHIVESARRHMGPGGRDTYSLDIYGNRGLDSQGLLQYLDTLIRVCRISYKVVLDSYKELHPFLGSNTQRDIYFGDTTIDKSEEFLTDNYDGPLPSDIRTKPIQISNPRWEHKKKDEGDKEPDVASIGDIVILMADIKNCPEGAEVVFDIYDTSVKPPKKVDSAKGKHNNGLGKGEWVVADKENKGEELKLEFEAVAKSKVSERCEIKIDTKTVCSILLCFDIDPNDSEVQDDEFILKGSDSTQPYYQKLTVRDDKIIGNKTLELNFLNVNPLWSYTLEINPGAEGSTYTLFENVPFKTISSLKFGV